VEVPGFDSPARSCDGECDGFFSFPKKEVQMARSVNKIILVGNVGRDPDIQLLPKGGGKVAHLSLATGRRRPEGSDGVDRTDWHRLTLRDRLAQFAEDHIRTGDRIYVEGSLEYDAYERDGITYPTADVNVTEVVWLPSPLATKEG
jgi:single-strand DNA-binding protein